MFSLFTVKEVLNLLIPDVQDLFSTISRYVRTVTVKTLMSAETKRNHTIMKEKTWIEKWPASVG